MLPGLAVFIETNGISFQIKLSSHAPPQRFPRFFLSLSANIRYPKFYRKFIKRFIFIMKLIDPTSDKTPC